MLVAGKGLDEDVMTNGTAARPVGAAREGRPREERAREKGSLRGRAVNEPSSSEPAASSWSSIESRAEVDLTLRLSAPGPQARTPSHPAVGFGLQNRGSGGRDRFRYHCGRAAVRQFNRG